MNPNLAKLFKDVLSDKLDSQCAVYNYVPDFAEFWKEENLESGQPLPAHKILEKASESTSKALIIVWGGMPDDEDDSGKILSPHLTPLDWALAFSMKMLALGEAHRVTFSIHIIDLTVKAYEDSFAMRMRATLLEEMSWVQLYAPLVPTNDKGQPVRYRRQYKTLASLIPVGNGVLSLQHDAQTMADSVQDQGASVKQALSLIANAWRASVLQSDDHHDLNNIVGPQVILQMMSGDRKVDNRISHNLSAFLKRLEWMGLVPTFRGDASYSAPGFKYSMDIVAIDDEFKRGWDRVLGFLLGISPASMTGTPDTSLDSLGATGSLRFYGATDPNCLSEALGINADVDVVTGLYNQRKFDSPVPPGSNGGESFPTSPPWMLVLDLRLFSGLAADESTWYATLARLALMLNDMKQDDLAWRGFGESERRQLNCLVKKESGDEFQLNTALSLLPRLCSLRWPSVPIIVLSATGRRTLISKLAEYGNIFLANPKPNVLGGNSLEQIPAFMESWKRELQAALSLVDLQLNILKLMQANNPAENMPTGTHKHIVMALDETGDFDKSPNSAIGGVLLVATENSKDDAIQRAFLFQEALREGGVNFYEKPPYYSDARDTGKPVAKIKNKKDNDDISTHIKQVMANNQKVTLAAFRYVIPRRNNTDHAYKDEAYLRGLTRCIELVVCELLPSLGLDWANNVTFSVWFANKQRAFKNEGKDDGNASAEAAVTYDFRHERAGRVETIGGFGKAYSIVLTAIGERGVFENVMKAVVSLKARKIPYSRAENLRYSSVNDWYCTRCKLITMSPIADAEASPTRCSHCHQEAVADYSVMSHLADAVLHREQSLMKTACGPFLAADYCFDAVEDDALKDFLHVARLFDQGRKQDGFKLAYKNGNFLDDMNEKDSGAKAPLARRLVQQLKVYAPSVKGIALAELAGIRTRGFEEMSARNPSSKGDARNPIANEKVRMAGIPQTDGKKVSSPSQLGGNAPQVREPAWYRITIKEYDANNEAQILAELKKVSPRGKMRLSFHPVKGYPRIQFKATAGEKDTVLAGIRQLDVFKERKFAMHSDPVKDGQH